MPATVKADLLFQPVVAADHIGAYFEKSLVMGAFAVPNNTLKQDAKAGDTVTMPFYKKIGDAEDLAETDVMQVDKLQDDSFSTTVKEIGKAVGFKDSAIVKSGDTEKGIPEEATRQIGRVMAEKVDKDLITEINTNGNFVLGFNGTTADANGYCNIQNILRGKINSFGDKQSEAKILVLHSQHIITFGVELFNKMVIKDANDPYAQVPGFMGRILDMVVVVNDQMPRQNDQASKRVYSALIMKEDPYGYIVKRDMNVEGDRDILARENVIAATQWYGVKSFHAKISALDYRIAQLRFVTEQAP